MSRRKRHAKTVVREDWQVSVCDLQEARATVGAGGMRPEQGPSPSSALTEEPVAVFYITAQNCLTRVSTAEQGLNSGQELWFQHQVQCQAWYPRGTGSVLVETVTQDCSYGASGSLWGVRSQVVWSLS